MEETEKENGIEKILSLNKEELEKIFSEMSIQEVIDISKAIGGVSSNE